MDLRSVEITNQLRSAIRAKLIELGVRYDEELPDYILIMVVNKKSKQHMNDDLQLFLDDNTESFVDWLHDQVLKKLQKVTVGKKKTNKDLSQTLVNIKEEDLKKEKTDVVVKKDKDEDFDKLVDELAILNEEADSNDLEDLIQTKYKESDKTSESENRLTNSNNVSVMEQSQIGLRRFSNEPGTPPISLTPPHISLTSSHTKSVSQRKETSTEDVSGIGLKNDSKEKKSNKRSSLEYNEKNLDKKADLPSKRSRITSSSDTDDSAKEHANNSKVSSSRPKITSVVTIKSRLGAIDPGKNSELREKSSNESSKISLKRDNEVRASESSSVRSKIVINKSPSKRTENDRSNMESAKEKSLKSLSTFLRNAQKPTKLGSIKSRLGAITIKPQDEEEEKQQVTKVSNIKSRLGKKIVQSPRVAKLETKRLKELLEEDFEDDSEGDEDDEELIKTSVRSHIIAINKKTKPIFKKNKTSKNSKKVVSESDTDEDEEEENEISEEEKNKVSSKVIVTPRPLKPLKPVQKRATQSLLLRAVAEANKSVVSQKKIDPCLKEESKKVTKGSLKSSSSLKKKVHNNYKKKPILEKIMVELPNTSAKEKSKKSRVGSDTLNHDDIVKSLFSKNERNPTFLVTLNGYNNNSKEKDSDIDDSNDENIAAIEIDAEGASFDDEYDDFPILEESDGIEMELDDEALELVRSRSQNNGDNSTISKPSYPKATKRKMSPIVFPQSQVKSTKATEQEPDVLNMALDDIISLPRFEKKPAINPAAPAVEKSGEVGEKCRYWPNCTLGTNCAYYHPEVPCSSFPACKFGEKCAYVHPKCKFGVSCTKVGCIFVHPPSIVPCKYHPYCKKPGCPYVHPKNITSLQILENTSQKSKFTWKKQD